MERLVQEIHVLDQDICSILSKNPRSTDDEQLLEYKRQRLASKEQELKEKEKEETDYQRKVELTGALSVFLALKCRYLICVLHSASCKTRYYGKLCPETR